jgi:hypothetical protein
VDGVRRRALLIARIDGEDAGAAALAPSLLAAGFTSGIKGFLKRAASAGPDGPEALGPAEQKE